MSRTKSRPHTKWNPKLSDKLVVNRIREHPRHAVKKGACAFRFSE